MEYFEGVADGNILALLAPSAQLVEPERCERPDERETHDERIEQRHRRIAEGQPCQHKADDRVDQAKEDCMRRSRVKIIDTAGKRGLQIGQADAADHGSCGDCSCAEQDTRMRHSRSLLMPTLRWPRRL